jgi:hypothetical protein
LIRRLQKAVVEPGLRDKMDIEDEILEDLQDWERLLGRQDQIIQ